MLRMHDVISTAARGTLCLKKVPPQPTGCYGRASDSNLEKPVRSCVLLRVAKLVTGSGC